MVEDEIIENTWKSMEYQIKEEDLNKCIEFAIKYHLDESKLATNRTTGQYRGLGGIIDSFVIGKLIEIGVSQIIQKDSKKECLLDFEIHKLTKANRADPDIIKIKEGGTEREPNLYVEIKNISEGDRWIGLTEEQFTTISSNKMVAGKEEKIVLIYAYLGKKGDGDIDPLGVYLKQNIDIDLLKKFCNVGDLYVKIKYVITGDELRKHGVEFKQGSYLYETDILKPAGKIAIKKISEGGGKFEIVKVHNGKIPIIMMGSGMVKPEEFGSFTVKGDVGIYKKINKDKQGKVSSQRMYILAKTDAEIDNNVLGKFKLKKHEVYEIQFTTVGMNPSLKRNNIWIAQRNISSITPKTVEEMIKEVIEKI